MGLFISFEGCEGSGKTTQAGLLHDRMATEGLKVLLVHEPGGTELGTNLRTWLTATNKPMTPEAELFLFTAARSELVRRVVRPALDSGMTVIADRYADSTTAYQGYGRRLPLRHVNGANELATDGLWPHLTVLLDAPTELLLRRARVQTSFDEQGRFDPTARAQGSELRRFEEASLEFHRRVRDGYLKLATKDPQRWLVVDAAEPTESIAARIWERTSELLAEHSPAPTGPTRLLDL